MVGHSPADWQGAARKLWEPMVEMYFFIPGGPDLAAVHTQNFGLGTQPSYRRGCFRRPLRRRSHGASRFKLRFVQQAAWHLLRPAVSGWTSGGGFWIAFPPGRCLGIDAAAMESLHAGWDEFHAVGVVAPLICIHEDSRNECGVIMIHAGALERVCRGLLNYAGGESVLIHVGSAAIFQPSRPAQGP